MNFLQQMNNKIEKPWNLRVKKKNKKLTDRLFPNIVLA